MHHQLRAVATQRLVERVGIAGVEGEIIGRLRIHLRRRNIIEAFRRLTVAFTHLGSEISRPAADRIGLQECKAAGAILLPDLKLGFLFEDPDQDRRIQVHVLGDHVLDQLRRDRLVGLGVGGERNFVAVAAGQHQTGCKGSRGDERANKRAIDQRLSSTPIGQFSHPNQSVMP